MPIVASETITDAHTQPGGGKYVIERHTDHQGKVYQVGPYLAAPGFDTGARLAARAVEIATQLAEAEAEQIVEQE